MAVSRVVLSGSTDGVPVVVAGTAIGAATTVHTAHATSMDEIWLWVVNTDSTARSLSLTEGGDVDPTNLILDAFSIPANGQLLIILPGVTLTNSKVLKAFASAASVLNVVGHVNRIS